MCEYKMSNFDLYYTAAFGEYDTVEEILKEGDCDVDFSNEHREGKTPLYIAASWGTDDHEAVIKLLLDYGADIDCTNDVLQTPLYVAASWGHVNIVKLLIKNGANVDAKNHEGRAPLHIASCWKPHGINEVNTNKFAGYEKEALKLMVERALESMKTSFTNYLEYLPNLTEDVVKLKEVSFQSNISDEAAELAILYNHFGVVAALVEAGADVNAKDNRGETPLYKALLAGNFEIAKYLENNAGQK